MQPNLKVSIMVDYAHEPESIKSILTMAKDWRTRQLFDKIIHIVSSCGTGRDDWKKPVTGSLSYSFADFSVVTTEDYGRGDDPQLILDTLSKNFPDETEIKVVTDWSKASKYITEVNRKKALNVALQIADKMASSYRKEACNVLILSTSVGSQQTMTQPEGEIEYDEREEWVKCFEGFIPAIPKPIIDKI